ncbi:hypothetical protein CXG81DRAFT_5799, partial [Caulochytrium protostelioides]
SSEMFIRVALDQLMHAKEARKNTDLKNACQDSLAMLDVVRMAPDAMTPSNLLVIFKALQLACESRQPALALIAVDCIAKLFVYNYWSQFEKAGPPLSILALVINTVSECFSTGENTEERLQLQIIKALLTAVTQVDPYASIHGDVLLQAVRCTYNIFLISRSANTQLVAQATIQQMVQAVFSRVKAQPPPTRPADLAPPSAPSLPSASASHHDPLPRSSSSPVVHDTAHSRGASSSSTPEATGGHTKHHLDDVSEGPPSSIPDTSEAGTPVTPRPRPLLTPTSTSAVSSARGGRGRDRDLVQELFLCDAYLVLRSLCKLAMKSQDGNNDLKTQAMRSRLLALYLIHSILSEFPDLFYLTLPPPLAAISGAAHVDAPFMAVVKQYLCLVISRNAVSPVPQVYDITIEILVKLLLQSRTLLKPELAVILTEIVLPTIEGRQGTPFHHRLSLIRILNRHLQDPHGAGGQCLLELYLNYDCDPQATSRENVWERLVVALSKVLLQHVGSEPSEGVGIDSGTPSLHSMFYAPTSDATPAFTTASLSNFSRDQVRDLLSTTGDPHVLKRRALELLTFGIVRPVVRWIDEQRRAAEQRTQQQREQHQALFQDLELPSPSLPNGMHHAAGTAAGAPAHGGGPVIQTDAAGFPKGSDDPLAFQTLKKRKQILSEGIKRFNFKPAKGIAFLISSGCISSDSPSDVAHFLLTQPLLKKSMIGEYLGEGDDYNIQVMHTFVDALDFQDKSFVDALREFLQSFRLPGEAQKIDRFMLKFAQRYLQGNPAAFSSADTAYVLAYSVVMLNTDQHSPQVKHRMTCEDFIKNNRGIDEGKDLDPAILTAIFEEIVRNEIVMKDEKPATAHPAGASASHDAVGGVISTAISQTLLPRGTSQARELMADFAQQSELQAQKTEAMLGAVLKMRPAAGTAHGAAGVLPAAHDGAAAPDGSGPGDALARAKPQGLPLPSVLVSDTFYHATHFEHGRSVFSVVWMSILTALTSILQVYDDREMVNMAFEGFRWSIWIACQFEMDLERTAFFQSLGRWIHINHPWEIRHKHLEAMRTLLEIAGQDGNHLAGNWKDVVHCMVLLEKLATINSNTDNENQTTLRLSADLTTGPGRDATPPAGPSYQDRKHLVETLAELANNSLTLQVDRIFTNSYTLNGPAIVALVRALCDVSTTEVDRIPPDTEQPRMMCLQRLIEIGHYNMGRIRMEWSQIWAILGEHFNRVGCSPNPTVAFFALDKLRQLAMKFLDGEELPSFKFQKDFLRPFEVIFVGNPNQNIRDMCLTCLSQMVQTKADRFKSGWKAVLSACAQAAQTDAEAIVQMGFNLVKQIVRNHLLSVAQNATFADLVGALVEYCRHPTMHRITFQAIELLEQTIHRLATQIYSNGMASNRLASATLGAQSSRETDDTGTKFWHPALTGLYEVVMSCEIEVRERGLTCLFDTTKKYGTRFTPEFWETICQDVLFPIFADLKPDEGATPAAATTSTAAAENDAHLSVWLSTTLVKALRLLVDLFTCHFDPLQQALPAILKLMCLCMTHANETIRRIGSTCLSELIENNATQFGEAQWDQFVDCYERLLDATTAYDLFYKVPYHTNLVATSARRPSPFAADAPNESSYLRSASGGLPAVAPKPSKKQFAKVFQKCLFHVFAIRTLDEILMKATRAAPHTEMEATQAYTCMTISQLMRLLGCLRASFEFASRFHDDVELRVELYRLLQLATLPNLLQQETAAASLFIRLLVQIQKDPQRVAVRDDLEDELIPLASTIFAAYNGMDPEVQARSITAWRPIMVPLLLGILNLDALKFRPCVALVYDDLVNLLKHDMTYDLRQVLMSVLLRIGSELHISA